MTNSNKKKLSYEQCYIQRFNFKINKKTENPEFVALWNAVENKTHCLHFLLSNGICSYLRQYQGFTDKDLDYLASKKTPEYQEWVRLNQEASNNNDRGD